jgi:hypothetical protein
MSSISKRAGEIGLHVGTEKDAVLLFIDVLL